MKKRERKPSKLDLLVKENGDLREELADLRKLLGTPEIHDFLEGVKREAAYQRDHWGEVHDAEKTDENWFWTLGWLAGKAVNDPHEPGDERTTVERKLHRIVTVAALACNWHAAVLKREGGKAT